MTADYWKALLGGMLIGAGAATLLLLNGEIAGISGIFGNAVRGVRREELADCLSGRIGAARRGAWIGAH